MKTKPNPFPFPQSILIPIILPSPHIPHSFTHFFTHTQRARVRQNALATDKKCKQQTAKAKKY
jgi:hypothetical protein